MEEVLWQNLVPGREYLIRRVVGPNPFRSDTHTADGIPLGQIKVGVFVEIIVAPHTIERATFRNLRNPPRDKEGPYLPSALGTVTQNSFSVANYRFYNVLPQDLKDKVRNSDIEEDRLRKYLADEVVGNISDLTNEVEKYGLKGGKKARRNKKSKRTKKSKRSKKIRKTNKRR